MIGGRFLAVGAALMWGVLFVMFDFNWEHATLIFLLLVGLAGLLAAFITAPFGFFDSDF